jgi:hypothetical protein
LGVVGGEQLVISASVGPQVRWRTAFIVAVVLCPRVACHGSPFFLPPHQAPHPLCKVLSFQNYFSNRKKKDFSSTRANAPRPPPLLSPSCRLPLHKSRQKVCTTRFSNCVAKGLFPATHDPRCSPTLAHAVTSYPLFCVSFFPPTFFTPCLPTPASTWAGAPPASASYVVCAHASHLFIAHTRVRVVRAQHLRFW